MRPTCVSVIIISIVTQLLPLSRASEKGDSDFGLDSILNPLTTANCVVLIDNQQNINLPDASGKSPIIIRRSVPVAFKAFSSYLFELRDYRITNHIFWAPVNSSQYTWMSKWSDTKYMRVCPTSKLLYGKPISTDNVNTDICLRIKFLDFAIYSKPWNCVAHFRLFPTFHGNTASIISPPAFVKYIEHPSYSNAFSDSVPPLHFFVHSNTLRQTENDSNEFIFKQKIPSSFAHIIDYFYYQTLRLQKLHTPRFPTKFESEQSYYSNDIIFFLQTQQSGTRKFIITKVQLAELCKNCYILNRFQSTVHIVFHLRHLSVTYLHLIFGSINKIHTLLFPPVNEELLWVSESIGCEHCEYAVMANMIDKLTRCESNFDFSIRTRAYTWYDIDTSSESLQKILAVAYAKVWLSAVTRNSTIISTPITSAICKNGRRANLPIYPLDIDPYAPFIQMNVFSHVRTNYFMPYQVSREISALKYITCSDRGLSGVLFSELVNVYDIWIWMWILISIFFIHLSLNILSTLKRDRIRHLISILRVIVEQGDPFLASTFQNYRVRYVLASFFLMGIVISNAYKNSNVYNMITRRKLVPYKSFDEMIADNMTIYARGVSLIAPYYSFEIVPNETFVAEFTNNGLEVAYKNYIAIVKSEIFATDEQLLETRKYSKNIPIINVKLINRTILHPTLPTIIKEVLDNLSKFKGNVINGLAYMRNHKSVEKIYSLTKSFYHEQMHELMHDLGECQKTALILPEYMAGKMVRKFRPRREFYVGKEIFSDFQWILSLAGFVPPYIITRIKSVEESGIWEWLKDIVVGDLVTSLEQVHPEDTPFAPANMKGNIVVIFAVWLTGTLLSLPLFMWERRYFIWKTVCATAIKIKAVFVRLWTYIVARVMRWKQMFGKRHGRIKRRHRKNVKIFNPSLLVFLKHEKRN